jgi:hypothetical protein
MHKWSHRDTAAMGCRLVLRDLGYLESLKRSNVRLTFDHIAHVEPDGVVTETGIECRSIHEGSNMTNVDQARRFISMF